MKRVLLVLAAAAVFLSTFVTPTIVRADGTPGSGSCGSNGTICKP